MSVQGSLALLDEVISAIQSMCLAQYGRENSVVEFCKKMCMSIKDNPHEVEINCGKLRDIWYYLDEELMSLEPENPSHAVSRSQWPGHHSHVDNRSYTGDETEESTGRDVQYS